MSKIPEVIQTTMSKIREMVDANTVVGSPMTIAEDVTLVPISKITLGMASGGADLAAKQQKPEGSFSGGAGCGVKVIPVAVVILQGDRVRVLPIDEPAKSASERAMEQLPGLIDKLIELVNPKQETAAEN